MPKFLDGHRYCRACRDPLPCARLARCTCWLGRRPMANNRLCAPELESAARGRRYDRSRVNHRQIAHLRRVPLRTNRQLGVPVVPTHPPRAPAPFKQGLVGPRPMEVGTAVQARTVACGCCARSTFEPSAASDRSGSSRRPGRSPSAQAGLVRPNVSPSRVKFVEGAARASSRGCCRGSAPRRGRRRSGRGGLASEGGLARTGGPLGQPRLRPVLRAPV